MPPAGQAAVLRLQRELKALAADPVPNVRACPSEKSMLEWHYVLEGASGTDYAGGVYHGRIVFPAQYPFKPPSISMLTPSGRFEPGARLCLSMSDFHPESWNPMWSVGSILTGLLSFMYDNQPTTGSVTSTAEQKRQFAADSFNFNMRNATFRSLFPDLVAEQQERQRAATARAAAAGTPAAPAQAAGAATAEAAPSWVFTLAALGTLGVLAAIIAIPIIDQLQQ